MLRSDVPGDGIDVGRPGIPLGHPDGRPEGRPEGKPVGRPLGKPGIVGIAIGVGGGGATGVGGGGRSNGLGITPHAQRRASRRELATRDARKRRVEERIERILRSD